MDVGLNYVASFKMNGDIFWNFVPVCKWVCNAANCRETLAHEDSGGPWGLK